MTKQLLQRSLAAAFAGGVASLLASPAGASSPLEYPDNGAASFSRGGAWLATANEPIATHYNPAALATQKSAFSIDLNLNFNKMCFDRRNPGNALAGPSQKNVGPSGLPNNIYLPACSERSSFPNTIPSLALAWRATSTLAFGLAIVPPATYGTADRTHGELAEGLNYPTYTKVPMAAPWRYMQVRELSTILFPTLSVGWEPLKRLRVGAGFVSGIAVINTKSASVANAQGEAEDSVGDHSFDDGLSNLRTKDLFVPGIVASIHWSVLPQLDLSVWGRYMDKIRAGEGTLISEQQAYFANGSRRPTCPFNPVGCGPQNQNGVVNTFPGDGPPALNHFQYTIPSEVRAGIRFHLPRTKARVVAGTDGEARDPLHDDVFDVEVNGSYTMNSQAERIEVRFNPNILVQPTNVRIPENADRLTGYKDSYGIRLGGQWNAIPDKLGIRLGGWMETQSQSAEFLQINVVGAQRYGFGGGLVFRQDFIDLSLGYQRLMSSALDNGGNGKLLAPAATNGQVSADPDFNNRTFHAVNGGKLTQSGHAFTIGGTIRF
jgi:hypothetical protein